MKVTLTITLMFLLVFEHAACKDALKAQCKTPTEPSPPTVSPNPSNNTDDYSPTTPPTDKGTDLPVVPSKGSKAPNIKVVGNKMVDESGKEFRCHGVNLQGTEYQCIHNNGYSEGIINQSYVDAMLEWNINCARIPLNEDCLIGSSALPSGTNATVIGPKYLQALKAEVDLLLSNGLVVILDLHWTHGKEGATKQWPMTSTKSAVQFWTQIAKSFSLPGVIFDLYNEPYVTNWDCWLKGGTACTTEDKTDYEVAGMNTLISAVRKTGSKNPVLIQGIGWGGDISGFLTHTPTDSAKQMIAGVHIYNFGSCVTTACYEEKIWPVAKKYPLIIGEIGENDCKHTFVDSLMAEADKHGVSYMGWAWFATGDCSQGPTLISDWKGTPTGLGEGFKAHYRTLGKAGAGSAKASNTDAPTSSTEETPAKSSNATSKPPRKRSKPYGHYMKMGLMKRRVPLLAH